jgi:hypothetical protein
MRRHTLVAIVAGALVAQASGVRAVCGDGVVDGTEVCDDGPANGSDACCSASCTAVDTDGDGLCDAEDACPGLDVRLKDTTLLVVRTPQQPSGDRLRFAGTMTLRNSPPLDPSASGMRLQMSTSDGFAPRALVIDAIVPPGDRWHAGRTGTSWTYRDPSGEAAGITRVDLQLLPPLVPTNVLTKVKFSIVGRRGSYPLTPAMVTSTIEHGIPSGNALLVSFGLGLPVAAYEQCGNAIYSTIAQNDCRFARNGNAITCAGPRPVGPCHTGDPDDLIICDVLDAAHAETTYFAENGVYFTGDCKDLPGFVPSPGVICSAHGDALAFTITAAHPLAIYTACTWTSDPGPGENLVCW